MDRQVRRDVIEGYLRKLAAIDRRHTVWRETYLPFAKATIQEAIFSELTDLRGRASDEWAPLVHAYIALARFLPPDDAQYLIQAEKVTSSIADKITRNQHVPKEEYDLLRQYEEGFVRLHAGITRDERDLIAQVAALNCDLTIEKTVTGYTIRRLS